MEKCSRPVVVLYALHQQTTKIGLIVWAACRECFGKIPSQDVLLVIRLDGDNEEME